MNAFSTQAQELFDYSRALRRDLHRHPELGFKEVRTASIVARELSQLGMEVTSGIAETGVVGLLEGARPGPVALLRFDMDALPVQEETEAEYASESPGIMHACGHDGHVAVGLTVARMLAACRESLQGSIKFIFQPAEEGLGGAERMIEAGVLDHPRADVTLALHLWNEKPVGWVGVTSGPLMPAADLFEVRLRGRGGHGALPHQAVDPLFAAAQIVTALQSIVARNVSPLDSAVVSVCRMRAGEAFNVIPQFAELAGTFRTYQPEIRQKVIDRFHDIVQGVARGMGCSAEVDIRRMTPAVINDARFAEAVRQAASETLPGISIEANYQTMVSEDMAFLMEQVPGCYFLVGSARPEGGYAHHHPRFDIDESVLPAAAALMAAAAVRVLSDCTSGSQNR